MLNLTKLNQKLDSMITNESNEMVKIGMTHGTKLFREMIKDTNLNPYWNVMGLNLIINIENDKEIKKGYEMVKETILNHIA